MKVSNRKCVRRLSRRSLAANRTRNIVAIVAIALTAMLFTSLFTIAFSINDGFQQANFRQAGGYSHGGFKYLTEEQYNELKDDPLIAEHGLRRFLGMPMEAPFNKSHVEIGYSDANEAKWTYCTPVEGRLPKEGTNEAATDTHVLALLGVEPKLGETFTVTFNVDGHETTQTFTLCGWWDYDEAVVANHILVPESRVDAVLDEVGVTLPADDGMTGSWNLDVMLASGARHIDADLNQILANHGYQSEERTDDGTFIDTGVNWGYTGAQITENLDPTTAAAVIGMLLLILLTGYLIIYNVFQISVAGDVRFYGLLKTIGTTPRQLRRMIRQQAFFLSIIGIPLGLVLGWLLGKVLLPVIVSQLNSIVLTTSVSPWIFVGSALFALVTVFISCLRPGRMAGRVSPVEALRYTEGSGRSKGSRKKESVSLFSMAWANLGRSRGKTIVTILSLALAVVLLTVTITLVRGFDMDKFVSLQVATDFQIADAGYFQTGGDAFNDEEALPEAVIEAVKAQGGITEGGAVYGDTSATLECVTEDWYRQGRNNFYSEEELDNMLNYEARTSEGLIYDRAQLYGMEDFPLSQLTVYEGDIASLREPGSRNIAAVYSEDDYGKLIPDSHWAKLGDQVTIYYVDSFEYVDPDTGEVYASLDNVPENKVNQLVRNPKDYRAITYTVTAVVAVPTSLSYRYYGSDEFILGADTFKQDTGTDSIMYYAFNTDDDATAAMEDFLKEYTTNVDPSYDYESKNTYIEQFEGMRNMFAMTGGALSLIVALVGVLNFFNAILTGITTRRREFAMLQSIGMTSKQLRRMLIIEGLLYTMGALLLALVLTLLMTPVMSQAVSSMFWFFSFKPTYWPILAMLPIFVIIGTVLPLLSGRLMSRHSIVDRLRQE